MQYQSSSFRTWHRWLSLIVGVQMVIWAVSGAYMVLVQLPFIHGVHLTQEADGEIQDNSLIERFPDIVQQYPEAEHMYLVNRLVQGEFRDLVQLETDGTSVLVDPHTRSQIEIGRDDIYQLASVYYAKGDPQISEVRYLKRFFDVSCGFSLIEQAPYRTANQIDHGDEVGLIPVAACA